MYNIGLSTARKVICEDLFKQYNKAGITKMEISLRFDEYKDINYEQIKEWAEKYSIDIWSFHLPFEPFSQIDVSDKNICKETINYYKGLIEKASEIGIKRFIVHPSSEPIKDEDRKERMKCAKESLATLADFAKRDNAVIAVENLPRTCLGRNSEEVSELISEHDELMVCFDTNHLLSENLVDFIYKLKNKIITTHISDYDFINERHWLPGEGEIDWQAVLKALKVVDYSGIWLYEIPFSCPNTIIRDRDLTCEDFVRNAEELFENKDVTLLGRKKEALGFWG